VRFEERVVSASAGIHHVTAICRDPANNVAFYTGNLGLRLVKRTVNFDDPSTWHLYYGDEVGRPGTALTFFAWGEQQPSGRNGNGMAAEAAFIIPESSLGYWAQRLIERDIAHEAPEKRFGERVLPFRDADGMRLALVAVKGAEEIPGWSNGDVPPEHALRGFRGVTLMVAAGEPTAEVLTGAFGFQAQAHEGHVVRYRAGSDRLATVIDVRTAEGFLAGHRLRAPCRVSRGH
jgi:glyoxalase family protein